jgi:hypothetical protein
MPVTVYVITFLKSHPPYNANEAAAFPRAQAAAFHASQVGKLSDADAATLATDISAYLMDHPIKNQRMRTEVTPDGNVVLRPAIEGEPILYGKDS